MKYHDISLDFSDETVRWITAPPFEFIERRRIDWGDENNSSAVAMSVHSGTHIDAPFHFVDGGSTIDSLPLKLFIGPALVHAVDAERYITKEHVDSISAHNEARVLFKTRNSGLLHESAYDPDVAAFSVETGDALVARGVKLVGLDYLSVAHADE